MKKIALIISYTGTNYSGWQSQQKGVAVQDLVEGAILKVCGQKVSVHASGRTDAGVHALGQVAHFETSSNLPVKRWCLAINAHLPKDIRVLESYEAPSDFHARFSAKKKTYEYRFYVNNIALPTFAATHAHVKPPFNYKTAAAATRQFEGTHNFKAFMSTGSSCVSCVRTIFNCALLNVEVNQYVLRVTGSGFLYNMVRIMAGTIIEAGKGGNCNINEIIESGNRKLAGPTAPACGLCLIKVEY